MTWRTEAKKDGVSAESPGKQLNMR